MNVPRRTFWLSVALAAAAMPALGQPVVPASAQGAASIPDFSGIWAHPYFPGFEPPASGPGPIVNRSRLRGGPRDGVGNANQFVGDWFVLCLAVDYLQHDVILASGFPRDHGARHRTADASGARCSV